MSVSNVKEFGLTQCKAERLELEPGKYKLEVWGASGGFTSQTNPINGAGGYAKGVLTLLEKTTVFVRVGSQGSNTTKGLGSQGCNGGGYTTAATRGRSGGGATDIRLNVDSLYSRILVAGGGGGTGSANSEYGGVGGGLFGGDARDDLFRAGKGGGQTGETLTCADGIATNCPKGIFGFGGNCTASSYGGGAGGGWFGGSATLIFEGGGGGSGYALTSSSFKPPNYLLTDSKYYLEDAVLLGGNESIPIPGSNKNTTGRMGNGYAMITLLKPIRLQPSVPSLLNFSFSGNEEIKDANRKFSFTYPGNFSSNVRAGTYQFNSTGALCGTSILTEFTIKRNAIMNVSISGNSIIYINDELLLNVPSIYSETELFVSHGMNIIQHYNASEFQCDSTQYATMSITYIPPIHNFCTFKQKYYHSSALLFIFTLIY
jgi:hypothetical protein